MTLILHSFKNLHRTRGASDLLEPDLRRAALDGIRDRVRQANPAVPVVEAPHGRLDPDLVFAAAEEEAPDELPLARLLREEPYKHAGRERARSAGVRRRDRCPRER